MQVKVESSNGLERRLRITVPAQQVESQVTARLRDTASKARINGFRPGRIPLQEIKRRFGAEIRQEVAGALVQESYFEAVQQEALKPAGMPNIENLKSESGQDLEFDAVFEVYPEITLADFNGIKIEKPLADVTDADVDRTIELLRKQQVEYHAVERVAARDDRVTIDYQGNLDGVPFEGGSAEGQELVLGSGSMIAGFEDGLIGHAPGAEVVLHLQFPENYHAKELAGKPVEFKVSIKQVAEPRLPALDDALFARFGVKEGGEAAFRSEIRGNLERELANAVKNRIRNQAFEGLAQTNAQVSIPQSLVKMEIDQMRRDAVQRFGGGKAAGLDASMLPEEMFADQATRRVTLSLLVSQIISRDGIVVDKDRVRETINSLASTYQDSQQVVDWYYSNEQQLHQVENQVLEEQVVERILSGAQVTERRMSYEEVMRAPSEAVPPAAESAEA